jgi:hypothetical protein
VVIRVLLVTVRRVSVVRGLAVVARFVVLGGFVVMTGGVRVVFGRLLVVICSVLGVGRSPTRPSEAHSWGKRGFLVDTSIRRDSAQWPARW